MSKKFMFSAVALVAFSFAGMANNEVKEVEKEDCFDQAVAFMDFIDAMMDYNSSDQVLTNALNQGIAYFCYGKGKLTVILELSN